MNKTFVVISFLFFISVFTISPAWSLEDRIIISEIDGNLFSALINSTIIMVNGNAIQKIESQNPEQIGKIFIFEEKNKGTDFWEIDLPTIVGIASVIVAGIGLYFGSKRFLVQRDDSLKIEFSKSLINFENQWTSARTDWKNIIPASYNTCFAMCAKRLSVLDSLAFLSTSKKIDEKMLKFFEFHFKEGMLYEKWSSEIEAYYAIQDNREPSKESSWPHFTQYVNEKNVEIASLDNLDREFFKIYRTETNDHEFSLNPKSF